jgi:hypothetical protein
VSYEASPNYWKLLQTTVTVSSRDKKAQRTGNVKGVTWPFIAYLKVGLASCVSYLQCCIIIQSSTAVTIRLADTYSTELTCSNKKTLINDVIVA